MKTPKEVFLHLGHSLRNTRGQDLLEYALMAGFLAVAAGAAIPGIATAISSVFSAIEAAITGSVPQSTYLGS